MCQKVRQIETCNMPPEFSASFSSGCNSYPILNPVSYRDLPGFQNLAGLAYTSPYLSQPLADTNGSRAPVGKIAHQQCCRVALR